MNTQHPGSQPQPQQANPYPSSEYYPPAGWQRKPPASGLRITTGVVALVLAVIGSIFAAMLLFGHHSGASTPFYGWMNLFLIVGSIGSLVTGIVIMAKQRKRGGATPWLVTAFAGLVLIACLGSMAGGDAGYPGGWTIVLPLALATVILAALVNVLGKPKR